MNKSITGLNIVADANMPQVESLFSGYGDVCLVDGRSITRESLANVDVLLVRSVTKVTLSLLDGTPVKFIGSATAGLDHIAPEILNHPAIHFANAAGANARSVVEYDLAVLAYLYHTLNFNPFNKCFGIIGYGNVGRMLAEQLVALGIQCKVYDPLLSEAFPCRVDQLSDLLDCDVICVHAPLTHAGPHPTHQMLSVSFLSSLQKGTVLISAGRGGIVDERAIMPFLQRNQLIYCADVWQDEPNINNELKQLSTIATPHIAGYSADSKVAATKMLLTAMLQSLVIDECDSLVDIAVPKKRISTDELDSNAALMAVIAEAFAVDRDDFNLRYINKDQTFDGLRAAYWQRREFNNFVVEAYEEASELLRAAGFQVAIKA